MRNELFHVKSTYPDVLNSYGRRTLSWMCSRENPSYLSGVDMRTESGAIQPALTMVQAQRTRSVLDPLHNVVALTPVLPSSVVAEAVAALSPDPRGRDGMGNEGWHMSSRPLLPKPLSTDLVTGL